MCLCMHLEVRTLNIFPEFPTLFTLERNVSIWHCSLSMIGKFIGIWMYSKVREFVFTCDSCIIIIIIKWLPMYGINWSLLCQSNTSNQCKHSTEYSIVINAPHYSNMRIDETDYGTNGPLISHQHRWLSVILAKCSSHHCVLTSYDAHCWWHWAPLGR